MGIKRTQYLVTILYVSVPIFYSYGPITFPVKFDFKLKSNKL